MVIQMVLQITVHRNNSQVPPIVKIYHSALVVLFRLFSKYAVNCNLFVSFPLLKK